MRFITLGPRGSNHEFVLHRYLDFHGIRDLATVDLAVDFQQGAQAVIDRRSDFLLQCAVHPATSATVARFFEGLYVIDTFISPSQDLAIIQRRDADKPRSLAVMRPTLDYVDSSQWEHIQLVDTVADVTAGLVDGTYAAGLGYAAVAQQHPEHLQVTQFIGTVDDAWIVYGRTRVSNGGLVASRDAPVAACYRELE